MQRLRRVILWSVLAGIALLAVLSIGGAFLATRSGERLGEFLALFLGDDLKAPSGAARAKALFNSGPLVAYWMLFGLLLAAGFVCFKRLLLSPAALGMHLGSLLVLGGAMWGSEKAHDVRRHVFGSDKVASGYLVVYEGRRENRILDPKTGAPIAQLPFDLYLRDFWIDYYEPKDKTWGLVVVAPVTDGAGHTIEERQVEVPWQVGPPVDVPLTRARLRVLRYLEKAVPVYAEGARPVIEVTGTDGATVVLAPQVGAEAKVADPPVTVRVVRVLENMRVTGMGEDRHVVDLPGEGTNPAVEIELETADGATQRRYVMALLPMHGGRPGEPEMRYVFPQPTGARPEPSSTVPAMEVLLECDGRRVQDWFLPQQGDPYVGMALAPVLAGEGEAERPETTAKLFLVRPAGPIRDYFSELAVLEKDRQVASKVIEVNDPLHWGGYHFYQADYDHEAGRYSLLTVSSDSGLLAVWAGFVLLVASTFWRFWGVAVWRYLAGKPAAETA